MELKKGRKREAVGGRVRTSADFHVGTYTAHRSWPGDRVDSNRVPAGCRLFLAEWLRLCPRSQGTAEQNSDCRYHRQRNPIPCPGDPNLPLMISMMAAHRFVAAVFVTAV